MTSARFDIEIAAHTTGDRELDALLQTMRNAGHDVAPFEAAAKKLGAELSALKDQQALIGSFSQLKTQTGTAAQALADAQQRAQQLGQALAATAEPTKKQTAEFERARKAVADAKDAYQGSVQQLQQLRGRMAEAGVSTTQLASQQVELRQRGQEAATAIAGLKASLQSMQDSERTAAEAAQALEASFRQLGIQAIKPVEAEVGRLQAALARLRGSTDVAPADKQAAVAAFNARLAELRSTATQAKPALDGVGAGGTAAAAGLGQAAHKAAAWLGAAAGFGQIKSIATDVVNTGAAFETLHIRLSNLLGSTQAASQAMAMIKELATSTPFEVTALAESFVKLKAFGLEPTRELMVTLSDTAANLGGGTEVLSGVTLALGQAWAKGRLQGEEILQLVERGVPVWDALARATGRSVPELQRMSEAGTLGRDVIAKLIDELGRMNQGASDKLMASFAGAVSNAKDALTEFFNMIASSGALDFLTSHLKAALAEFDRMKQTGELAQVAKKISDGFVGTATAVKSAADAFVTLYPAIEAATKVALALKAVDMAKSLYAMATGAHAAAAGLAAAGAQGATAAAGMATATTAATGLATAMRVLRAATGVGLAIGVAELVAEFFRAKAAAEAGERAVKQMLAPTPVNGPKQAATEAAAAMGGLGQAAERAAADMRAAFDKAIAEGKRVDEALGHIGKDFDLSKAPGIAAAAQVLDGLVVAGKISAEQFRQAWENALKGVDLAAFEANARKAFAGGVEGTLRLKGVLDEGLREAIRRSGADFDVLAGGMSKASVSAVADTDLIINGLDQLAAQGIDTAAALTASLGKGIETANTQKAIEAVKAQIEQVRNVLGDKVADGLLKQAGDAADVLKKKLEDAKPGIQSAAEAMRQLGITSDAELKKVATSAQAAFDTLRSSGTASAREMQEAFKKMAQAAIDANGGIAPATIKAQAEMYKLKITTDEFGKSVISAMESGAAGAQKFGAAVADATSKLEAQNAALERQIAAQEKANELNERAAQLERDRLNVDKQGYTKDADGNRMQVSVNTPMERAFKDGYVKRDQNGNYDPDAMKRALILIDERDKLNEERLRAGVRGNAGGVSNGASAATASTAAKTYNVQIGNRKVETTSDASARSLIAALKEAQMSA